jgi:HEAT repeat protein
MNDVVLQKPGSESGNGSDVLPSVDLSDTMADLRALQKVLAEGGRDMRTSNADALLEALRKVDPLADGSRLASCLVQFLRHPSPQVRSKATLLLGRANLNLNRVRGFLETGDDRSRANAVESLWGHVSLENVRKLLWEAARDRNRRVVVNALLGLCKGGDRPAFGRLQALADSPDPVTRAGVAWAMGELEAPEFDAVLEKLEQDADEKVRSMVARSKKKREPQTETKPEPKTDA